MTSSPLIFARDATHEDIDRICERVRFADRLEWAASGVTPMASVLHLGLDVLHEGDAMRAAVAGGEPMLLYGASRSLDPDGWVCGSCWMIAHEEAAAIALPLHKAILPELEALQGAHPKLWAEAWSGNALHLKWLAWLGFKRLGARRAGPYNETFIAYERTAP